MSSVSLILSHFVRRGLFSMRYGYEYVTGLWKNDGKSNLFKFDFACLSRRKNNIR